jgi:hypothetical protein
VSPVLKVPRQCPLVPLVEVMHMIGINFYMTLEGLHCSEVWTDIGRAALGRNFDVTIGRAWNLRTDSAVALGPSKTLIELAGRRTFRMQNDFQPAVWH